MPTTQIVPETPSRTPESVRISTVGVGVAGGRVTVRYSIENTNTNNHMSDAHGHVQTVNRRPTLTLPRLDSKWLEKQQNYRFLQDLIGLQA